MVQGGLTTGLLHALVAMDMPGPGTVFLNQNWQFPAPVFIGDTITAEAEVSKVHATKPVTTLKINVTRQTRRPSWREKLSVTHFPQKTKVDPPSRHHLNAAMGRMHPRDSQGNGRQTNHLSRWVK